MTTLLEVKDAFKRYGERELLDGATIALSDAYKVGLIGRNGAGKSTLCRVILGEEELDAGEVIFHPDLRLGYLRQHDPFHPGETVIEFLLRDSGQPDWRCGEVAGQFEIKGPQLERPVQELSGGWQTRVKLAALLLHDPNLLLLDEPTNFLDLRTQLLLEEFLREFRGACLIVSHDRAFLKATCERTLELSRGRLTMFPGDVDVYIANQAERKLHDERVNASVMAKRRQLEEFIAKNRANAATASQARSKAKQLERLETIDIEGPEASVQIRAPQVDVRKGTALRCKELAIGYDQHVVADGIEIEIEHGKRTAIVGDNGQGKTTFLRTITESLTPLAGTVRWGFGCDIGTYAQHVYSTLPPQQTVMDYLEVRATPETKTQSILNAAGSFLFRGDDIHKKIKVLSGGERARLCLCGLLLSKHNVLILDEPGNHLDVETVESLAQALTDYQGTVVFTSHDRYFMERIATNVVEVRDGRVTNYSGKYSDYVYRVGKEVAEGQREAHPAKAAPKRVEKKVELTKEQKKAEGRRQYELGKEIASIERQIQKIEERRKALKEQLATATDGGQIQQINRELADIMVKVTPLEERWEVLQAERQ